MQLLTPEDIWRTLDEQWDKLVASEKNQPEMRERMRRMVCAEASPSGFYSKIGRIFEGEG
jgi:hypothetical protein